MRTHLRGVMRIFLMCCFAGPSLADQNAPIISGNYVQVVKELCGTNSAAPAMYVTGLANFDPSTGTMTRAGYSEAISTSSQESAVNTVFHYSNTPTSVTLVNMMGGGTVTYHAVYGTVVHGVPLYFALIATDPSGCARQAEYTFVFGE